MSPRLFLGYFVALAACATVAFASAWTGDADAQGPAPQESAASVHSLTLPDTSMRRNLALRKHCQLALAQ